MREYASDLNGQAGLRGSHSEVSIWVLLFGTVSMGGVALAASLRDLRAFAGRPADEKTQASSGQLHRAQRAVGRFAWILIADLVFGSSVGPMIIAMHADLEGFRFAAALLAGPATILLAAIPLLLSTVADLERRARDVPVGTRLFSVRVARLTRLSRYACSGSLP